MPEVGLWESLSYPAAIALVGGLPSSFIFFFFIYKLDTRKQKTEICLPPIIILSLIAYFVIWLISFSATKNREDVINRNLLTIETLELEASDLNVKLQPYVVEAIQKIEQAQKDKGLGSFLFLTEPPFKYLYRANYLTMEEFLVAQQFVRQCYSGEEGEAAREYLSRYPVDGATLSKKLVKAQSMLADQVIQRDCLNSVSLTFLE